MKDDLESLSSTLAGEGQSHLLRFAPELAAEERAALAKQIVAIDFDKLRRLREEATTPATTLDPTSIEPIDAIALPRTEADHARARAAREAGLAALRAGRVAAVLVAGGQGSRLGFEHPKGMFPIGPVSGASLFQIHAEKILAWRREAGRAIPWRIMTSPTNYAETVEFFEKNAYFGLPKEDVGFFMQGTMPAIDLETGEVLMAGRGEIFTSPNGHGGCLLAMREEGILDDFAKRGVDLVYYFQVDNPFINVLDPEFIGYHLMNEADVSLKVIRKQHASEKLGLVVSAHRKPTIIEYSDLPDELARRTSSSGELLFWTGSIAIHVFSRPFLERITSAELGLPIHFARKKVPFVDAAGKLVEPSAINALKFEMFIFDCLPMAKKVAVVETDRVEEYEPVKNADGEHSPAIVKKAIARRAGKWLAKAGVKYPVDKNGEPAVDLEISPLAGIDAETFAKRLGDKTPVMGPKYFKGSQ